MNCATFLISHVIHFSLKTPHVPGLILSVSLGCWTCDPVWGCLSRLFSDFHSYLHPFLLSPDCCLPWVSLFVLFPVQDWPVGLPASAWGAVLVITMRLNKGQGFGGPEKPKWHNLLVFKNQTQNHSLLFNVAPHSFQAYWDVLHVTFSASCCQPLEPLLHACQAELSFPRWCTQEVLGKCWLNERIGLPN